MKSVKQLGFGVLIGAIMSCGCCCYYKSYSDKKLEFRLQEQHFAMISSLTSLYKCCQEYSDHKNSNQNINH